VVQFVIANREAKIVINTGVGDIAQSVRCL